MNPAQILSRAQFETPEIWSQIATDYTGRLLPAFQFFSRQALERLAPRGRLLDLACGPGTFSIEAAPHVEAVTAVDFSQSMLDALAQRARAAELSNITALRMDGHALNLADASFECVVSMFGVVHFERPEQGLAEMHRVLKLGGRFMASTWAPPSRSPFVQVVVAALRASLPDLPQDDVIFHSLCTPDGWLSKITAAGFSDARYECVEMPVEVPAPEPFWENMKAASVPVVLLKRVGISLGAEAIVCLR